MMHRRNFISTLGSVAVLPLAGVPARPGPKPDQPTRDERMAMAEVAKAFMSQYSVPGFSFAVGHSGEIVHQDALGWADRESGEAVTPAHLFRIASISKPITSVAIFTLIEQGGLALSDKVFGPGARLGADYYNPLYPAMVQEITVDHLLTHSCGGWSNKHPDPMFTNNTMDHAQLITWTLRNQALENHPGRIFAYSNFGYCLLGRVVEKVSGQTYEEFVSKTVLRRCGITDMSVAGNTLAGRRLNEVRYYGQNGENPYALNVKRLDSHGGWIASATSLVKFAMHVSGFAKPASILRPRTIATMTTPSGPNDKYARGWQVNGSSWWHTGSMFGTKTLLIRAKNGLCFAALCNSRDNVAAKSSMTRDLDRLVWTMVRKVKAWRA
jgi:CubicO group peptidase (beta-lactamase class C family)